jgi:hypothetical protein
MKVWQKWAIVSVAAIAAAAIFLLADPLSRAPLPAGAVPARDVVSLCVGDATGDGVPEMLAIAGEGETGAGERFGELLLVCDASARADMDALGHIPPERVRRRIDLAEIKPMKVQLGDVNGDGLNEVAICVYKTAKFHPVMAKRPFFFDLVEGKLVPVWLGSRLSRPFDDYILYDIDAVDEIISVERLENGDRAVAAYDWKGFGFEMRAQTAETGRTESADEAAGSFNPKFGRVGAPYEAVEIAPNVADYTVAPDLSNVVNLDQFPNLTEGQRKKLADNGFVVAPSGQEQLFYVYDDNTYKGIPHFVTTDSVLQVYHIFYDYALRSVEGLTLFPNALALNDGMLARLREECDAISEPAVKAEAMKALGYFGVAGLAFGETLPADFPAELKPLVESEAALVDAADGRRPSPLFGHEIDYSIFTPRGHYTRSEELTKYFKGMSWYGFVPFPLYASDGVTRDEKSAMRAIIVAAAMYRRAERAGDAGALWENIYSPTAFFVGEANDVTPFSLNGIVSKVYNMAVVADVHTAHPGGYLEEAVGTAAEIYVVAPMGGRLWLTRGAVFDYFEFVSQKRLSDAEWQAMLREAAPARPPFTSSYMEGEAPEFPAPDADYGSDS